jgi:hypothetical protein
MTIDELDRLHAAATAGPWHGWYTTNSPWVGIDSPTGPVVESYHMRTEDVRAIVALHNAWPEVSARLRAAEAEVERLRAHPNCHAVDCSGYGCEVARRARHHLPSEVSMTAPDPRPFAAPGDLITAADVAAWLRENAPRYYGDGVADALDARLDRERRQACERGWQAHAAASRQRGRQAREARQKGWTEWAAQRERERAHHMARALAFRAAARQP